MLGERDGVARRLRTRMDGDLQLAARRVDEELGSAAPLVGQQQDPLAGRPEGEDPVEPPRREELDVRREPVLVQCVAAVTNKPAACTHMPAAIRPLRPNRSLNGPVTVCKTPHTAG